MTRHQQIAVAYVILAVGVAVAIYLAVTQAQERAERERRVLVTACTDVNERDQLLADGILTLALDNGLEAEAVAIITDALAPRDCEEVYGRP